jgi:adenylylsulfate kinase-like enzyme
MANAVEVGAASIPRDNYPRVIWCFGRSGAGKTTIADGLAEQFRARAIATLHLDGESVRSGLSLDLGFSSRDRAENHRRIAELAMIARQQGVQVVVSSMAPLRVHRDTVESILPNAVCWIHVDSSPEICEARDPKLLYRRARDGRIPDFLDFPFEAPEEDERAWSVSTESMSPKESIQMLWNRLISEPCEPD